MTTLESAETRRVRRRTVHTWLALAAAGVATLGPAAAGPGPPAALAFAGPAQPAGDSARDSGGWWVSAYGVVDRERDARVGRAEAVFARVAAAADKRGNRLPRLVVVAADREPFAVALPDGSIVLTRGALDFCYGPGAAAGAGGAGAGRGDQRLAFVLGHELAHLARDDFWHRAAFAATERFPAPGPRADRVRALLEPGPGDLRKTELQADFDGALYMAMAGYSLRDLFAADPDFFARWVAQAGIDAAYEDPSHPRPEERGDVLRSQLEEVVWDLDYFEAGVRLAQLGRYQDAILFLERFKDRFAGREVLADLGYAHYQLALQALARCDGQPAVRFRLPVAVDDETLAERARLRGGASPCLESEAVRRRFAEARRFLELAIERDPAYLPARWNLMALEIVSSRHAAAIVLADETLERFPADAAALNAKGVGLYLFGQESRIESVDMALAVLAEAESDPRRAADAVFNQAVVLAERGRQAAARAAWERFLLLEPRGAHADLARERLGLPPAPPPPAPPVPPSPVPLGVVGPEAAAALRAMESRPFVIGALRGTFHTDRGGAVRALQIGDAIEVVEVVEVVEQEANGSAGAEAPAGDPLARVETPRGVLLRFAGHALDYEGGRLRAVVHFAPAR